MSDSQLPTYARFYTHSAKKGDPDPTKHNKPEWHDVVMAEIMIKGDKNTSHSKRVFEDDGATAILDRDGMPLTEKYPKAWQAFKSGSDEYSEGTSLMVLPGVGVSDKRNMENQGIMCVEDLANLGDNVVIGNAGMVNLRKAAQAYLNVLEPEKAEAEKAEREHEMQSLKDQIEEMKALMAENIANNEQVKRTRRKRNPETGILE